MMKILNSYMLHGRSLQEVFSLAAKSGCNGISIEPTQIDELSLDVLKKQFALNVVAVGAYFLDESDESACIELIEENAAKAAAHGIRRLCIVLRGINGALPSRSHRLRLLRSVTECASEYGVSLSLEPLHYSLHHISTLTSLNDAVELIREIDSPWLSLTLDVAHCFSEGIDSTDIESLAPWIGSVHLADLTGTDQDWRDFPGEGRLPLAEIAFHLRRGGYCGDWELEVIRGNLRELTDDALCAKIEHAFAFTGSSVVCGEVAKHILIGTSGHFLGQEPGGGSGTIAAQMCLLGETPMLLGVCGDDSVGHWLRASFRAFAPFELCQSGQTTSVVTIRTGMSTIQKGSVDITSLVSQILRLPDCQYYGYLPMFPGYEAPLKALSDRPSWQMVHDYGYYLWCGNADEIIRRAVTVEPAGFCALVNAKEMSDTEKETLGRFFIERGYQYALLTDESRPVLLFSHNCDESTKIPVMPIEKPILTCGAGDCFTAGLLVALVQGKNIVAAVHAGIENARKNLQANRMYSQNLSSLELFTD